MTTSDRAGNGAEPLTGEAFRLRNWICKVARFSETGAFGRELTTRLAALAAAPTQSGAEGPATLDRRERRAAAWARARFRARIDNVLAHGAEPPEYPGLVLVPKPAIDAAIAALRELDVLRSGAEVAAAPGLSEADDVMLFWLLDRLSDHDGECEIVADGWCQSHGYGDPCAVQEARLIVDAPDRYAALRALAARLTAKP